jgi:hypothetical protein
MKHEQALLSFEGEEEQGVRNGGMDFVIRVGVGVVALVGGTVSRARKMGDGVVHGDVLLVRGGGGGGGEGRECECVFVIVSSSVLFIPSTSFFLQYIPPIPSST